MFRRAACSLIVRPSDGRVLAVSRRGNLKAWGLPGGQREPGESLIKTAARELYEETGVTMNPATAVKLLDAQSTNGYRCATFYVPEWDGIPRSSWEGRVAWKTWEALLCGPFSSYIEKLAWRFWKLATDPQA